MISINFEENGQIKPIQDQLNILTKPAWAQTKSHLGILLLQYLVIILVFLVGDIHV